MTNQKESITMDLKKESVRIRNGMIAVFPQLSMMENIIEISELVPKFNGCYASNNSTVCYVSENEVFVTPYTRKVMSALESAGFKKEHFYVLFSNGDYPKFEKNIWNELRLKARKSYEEDFAEDCIAYCDSHNIGTISEDFLGNCFEMPMTGVKVKHLYFEDCYYPVVTSSIVDCTTIDNIGHYCTNNGRVVFVYRNGKTYVTKGYKIVSELRAAGYTKSDMFVPFSNCELIQDPILRARWESIIKK
jgi:hypothetical protein